MNKLKPFYKNFSGSVEMTNDREFITKGIYKNLDKDYIEIT